MLRSIRLLTVALVLLGPLTALAQTEPVGSHLVRCVDPAAAFVAEWQMLDGAAGPLGCSVGDAAMQGDWTVQEFRRGIIAHNSRATELKLYAWSMRASLWVRVQLPGELNGEPVSGFEVAVINPSDGAVASRSTGDSGMAILSPTPTTLQTLQVLVRVTRTGPEWVDADGIAQPGLPYDDRVDMGQVKSPFTWHQIDFSFSADASSTLLSQWRDQARSGIYRFNACWDRETAFTLKDRGAEDFVILALGKMNAFKTAGMEFCPMDRLLSETRNLKQQTQDALLNSGVFGYRGTSIEKGIGIAGLCKRQGEYDTAMWGLVRLLLEFEAELREMRPGSNLSPYDHVLENLLRSYDGRYQYQASYTHDGFCDIEIPETENHILLIESSRYLINQLLIKKYGYNSRWDNSANGQTQWLLRQLQRFFEQDFYEYNSRPYQRYSWYALANLADHASEQSIVDAARLTITYLDAKFAVSSHDLRRYAPMRRKPEPKYAADVNFFGDGHDAQTARYVYFSGLTSRVDNRSEPLSRIKPSDLMDRSFRSAHFSLSHDLLVAAMTKQSPHPEILDLVRTPGKLSFFQGFVHRGNAEKNQFTASNDGFEIYAADEVFLLSAGGGMHGHGYDYDQYPAEGLIAGASNVGAQLPSEVIGDLLGLWFIGEGKITGGVLGSILYPIVRQVAKDEAYASAAKNMAITRPTTVLTSIGAITADETLQFQGSAIPSLVFNSCVGPNFICGLRTRLPAFKVASLDLCSRYQLFDQDIATYWNFKRDELGCPLIGGERRTANGTIVEFDNGLVFKSAKWEGRIQTVTVDKSSQPYKITYRWQSPAPGYDFYLPFLRYPNKNGAFGRPDAWDFQFSTTGEWTFDAPMPGRYGIILRGCTGGPGPEVDFYKTRCDELPELEFDIPDASRPPPLPVCDAQVPEHAMPGARNIVMIGLGIRDPDRGQCTVLINIGLITAVCDEKFDAPQCLEHGGSFGLAEVAPARLRFDEFAAEFARRNRTKLFKFDFGTPNSFLSTSNQTVVFHFQPSSLYEWAIKSHSDLPGLSPDMTTWPLVWGTVIKSNNRLVSIASPLSGATIELNFFDQPLLIE
jgi:hypothetical protein